jgi:hypothetical protein
MSDKPAAPNPAWQTGLASWTADPSAPTQAIAAIDTASHADLDLNAWVVGALFADHYWTGSRMNTEQLSADLLATLQKPLADCNRAAVAAFASWSGLLVRSSAADAGAIPRTGNVYDSPDVAVSGSAELSVQELIVDWDQTDWGAIGLKNFAYGRAASINLQVTVTQPVLRMYVIPAGLGVPPPTEWTQLFTWPPKPGRAVPLQNIAGSSLLQPGDRCASASPFQWDVQGNDAYSVIALPGSEFFTNDPSLIPSTNWDTAIWIVNNGGAGWRNYSVLTYRMLLKIRNLDPGVETFALEAHCNGLEPGTRVSLKSEGAVAFRSSLVTARERELLIVQVDLPARHDGRLTLDVVTPRRSAFPPHASIEVRAYWSLPPAHPHHADAAAIGQPGRLWFGSYTFRAR